MTDSPSDLHSDSSPWSPGMAPKAAAGTGPHFRILTAFPQLIEALRLDGVVGRALKKKLVSLETRNPREFSNDVHKTIDDRPFGGGDGMVLLAENFDQILDSIENVGELIFFTPQGEKLHDGLVQELVQQKDITMICGRYSGVDQRLLNRHRHREVSLGDFVISGGELAAMVLVDAVTRFVPGVLGHEESAARDSLTMGTLEPPVFTRPREWRGQSVPEILLSGHHGRVQEWSWAVGLAVTYLKRPDLWRRAKDGLDAKARQKLRLHLEGISDEDWRVLGLSALDRASFLGEI